MRVPIYSCVEVTVTGRRLRRRRFTPARGCEEAPECVLDVPAGCALWRAGDDALLVLDYGGEVAELDAKGALDAAAVGAFGIRLAGAEPAGVTGR
jgi:hypothetical protein